jgi:hypothetical protein
MVLFGSRLRNDTGPIFVVQAWRHPVLGSDNKKGIYGAFDLVLESFQHVLNWNPKQVFGARNMSPRISIHSSILHPWYILNELGVQVSWRIYTINVWKEMITKSSKKDWKSRKMTKNRTWTLIEDRLIATNWIWPRERQDIWTAFLSRAWMIWESLGLNGISLKKARNTMDISLRSHNRQRTGLGFYKLDGTDCAAKARIFKREAAFNPRLQNSSRNHIPEQLRPSNTNFSVKR